MPNHPIFCPPFGALETVVDPAAVQKHGLVSLLAHSPKRPITAPSSVLCKTRPWSAHACLPA